MNVAKRKQVSTVVPPIRGSVEDAVRALLQTPPPPAGHPSTRKRQTVSYTIHGKVLRLKVPRGVILFWGGSPWQPTNWVCTPEILRQLKAENQSVKFEVLKPEAIGRQRHRR